MAIILSANCLITRGHLRSLMVDYQRQKYYLINNDIAEILLQKTIDLSSVPGEYSSFFNTMMQEDILFNIPDEDGIFFAPLPDEFDVPSHIINAIVDIREIFHDLDIFSQLTALLCRHIEIRFFEKFDYKYFADIFGIIEDTTLETEDVYLPYVHYRQYRDELEKLMSINVRLRLLYVHSCPPDMETVTQTGRILFTTQKINSVKICGLISEFHFSSNLQTYFESTNHNTCLNRKISIDEHGEIKNCPSIPDSYGNIKNTTLIQALEKPGFKKLWSVSKSQINKCSDCEFRNVCTDCRAFIDEPENIYSAPLKCGYDPYNCSWEEWSNNPLKQQAINYYEMSDYL